MIKITLNELHQANAALGKILTQPMEFKLSYRLMRLTKKLLSEQKVIDDARLELIKRIGSKMPNGNYGVPPEKMEEFMNELETVLKEEIEIDADPIPLSLIETSGVKLSPAELVIIENLIEIPETPADAKI